VGRGAGVRVQELGDRGENQKSNIKEQNYKLKFKNRREKPRINWGVKYDPQPEDPCRERQG